jgi:MFS family permease
MMALGSGSFAVGISIYILFANLPALIAGSIMRGVGWSLFQPSIMSLMVDTRNKVIRSERRVSIISLGPALSMTVGPTIGSSLLLVGSFPLIFAGGIAASLGSMLTIAILIKDDGRRDRSKPLFTGELRQLRSILKRDYSLSLVARLFMSHLFASTSVFVPLLAVQRLGFREAEVGVLFAVSALMNVFSRYLGGMATIRFGEKRVLVTATLFGAASSFLCAFAAAPIMIWIAMPIYGAGMGLFIPSGISYVGKIAPRQNVTVAMAAYSLMTDVGLTSGSTASSTIFPLGGFQTLFIVATVLGLSAATAQQLTRQPLSEHE